VAAGLILVRSDSSLFGWSDRFPAAGSMSWGTTCCRGRSQPRTSGDRIHAARNCLVGDCRAVGTGDRFRNACRADRDLSWGLIWRNSPGKHQGGYWQFSLFSRPVAGTALWGRLLAQALSLLHGLAHNCSCACWGWLAGEPTARSLRKCHRQVSSRAGRAGRLASYYRRRTCMSHSHTDNLSVTAGSLACGSVLVS
jgi:hypothetical protein